MSEDGRQSSFVPSNRQNAGVSADLAAGQTKSVGFLALEDDKFPLGVRQRRDPGNALADALDQGIGGRIRADRHLHFHFIKARQAKLHLLCRRNEIDLSAPRLRHCAASGNSCSQKARQTKVSAKYSHDRIKAQPH